MIPRAFTAGGEPGSRTPRERRIRTWGESSAGLAVLLAAVLFVPAACGGSSGAAGSTGERKDGGGKSAARIRVAPGHGAQDVGTTGELAVRAAKGGLTRVEVRDAEGTPVEGRLARGGSSWKPESHLATDTSYTVRAVAEDAEGRRTAKTSRFTTLEPESTATATYTPEDGSTVGVGMPVSLTFDRPVQHRKEVAEAISVTADPGVEVAGHWFGDRRIDFRPEKYWKKGTKVRLRMDLDGAEVSDGVHGTQDRSVAFTVGRSQVSVVDVKKKTMTVERDGRRLRSVPVSAGTAEHPTYNGRMVITERHERTRMDGDTVGFGRDEDSGGYDIKDVPHAMRLSDSGTFIHGNYWNPASSFGRQNLSHGCIGLRDAKGGGDSSAPGAWFYSRSLPGDVVEVRNSRDTTIEPDNGLNGWNMDWQEWKAG